MKQKLFNLLAVFILCLCFSTLYAQESTNAAGGDASGNGGTVSYSVGQVVCNSDTSAAGAVTKGVEQPYEILVVTGIGDRNIELGLSVYPNPTTDYLTLKIENRILDDLSYQLYDNSGRLLLNEEIYDFNTQIATSHLVSATYHLRVTENEKLIKNFKIIKR